MAVAQRNPVSLSYSDRGFNAIDWVAFVLMIIGGINWGLVGIAHFDLVAAIFGDMSALSRAVYTLVGLAALYGIYMAMRFSSANRNP